MREIDKALAYHAASLAFGSTYAIAQMCRHDPRHGVIVPDLKAMDNMIALGVQPSQIVVMSEQKPRRSPEAVIDDAYSLSSI